MAAGYEGCRPVFSLMISMDLHDANSDVVVSAFPGVLCVSLSLFFLLFSMYPRLSV